MEKKPHKYWYCSVLVIIITGILMKVCLPSPKCIVMNLFFHNFVIWLKIYEKHWQNLLLWTNKGNHYAKSEDMLIKPYISIIYLQLFFRARTWEIFFCIFSYVFKIKCFLGSYIGMKVANITVKIHYSRNKLLIFSAIFVTCTFIQLVLTT